MSNVIYLDKRRRLRVDKATGKVSGGDTEEPTGDRLERIRASLARIDTLMEDLKQYGQFQGREYPPCD